jgi:hypothetical protein
VEEESCRSRGRAGKSYKKAHAVMQRYGLLLAAVAAKKARLQIQPFFASLSWAFSLTSLKSGAKLPVQSDQSQRLPALRASNNSRSF